MFAQNGSELHINLDKSTLSFDMKSDLGQTQAFGGDGRIYLTLKDSNVYFKGNGGKIDTVFVENGMIAFRGSSLENRTLQINTLKEAGYSFAQTLKLGISINPQAGISDQIIIEDIPYNERIHTQITLAYDQAWNPNQENIPNKQLTILKYKGMGELQTSKISISTMGFNEIHTTLFTQEAQGYQEVYVDLNQKPKIKLSHSQIQSSFLSSIGLYGGYFSLLDSLNQRLGELKTNPNSIRFGF